MFGICNLANIPLRIEPSDRSELVSQVLFGEHFTVLEHTQKWSRIHLVYDDYEGWVDNKQFTKITEEQFEQLSKDSIVLNSDLIEYITSPKNILIPIPLGASLSFLNYEAINTENFSFEGLKIINLNKVLMILIRLNKAWCNHK